MKTLYWTRTPFAVTATWRDASGIYSRQFPAAWTDAQITECIEGAPAPVKAGTPPPRPPQVKPAPVLVEEDIPLMKLKKVDLLTRLEQHGITGCGSEPRYTLIKRLSEAENKARP